MQIVVDWIDQVESVVAARDAIAQFGADVVGVSFVVATNAALLGKLKNAQVAFSCSWTPSFGAEIVVSGPRRGSRRTIVIEPSDTAVQSTNCCCHQAGSRKPEHSRKRKRSFDSGAVLPPALTHFTAHYQVCCFPLWQRKWFGGETFDWTRLSNALLL